MPWGELTEPRACLGLRIGSRAGRLRLRRGIRDHHSPTHDRHRLVVGDPMQPGSQRDLPPLLRQRAKGRRHRVLHRVLGLVGIPEDPPAATEELLVVAPEDRLERGHLAACGQSGQLPITEQAQRELRQRLRL
jgi:hypothetical protein